MTLFSIVNLTTGISCLLLSIIIFRYSKNFTHFLWGGLNLCIALWGSAFYLAGISETSMQAIFYWKLSNVPYIFISALFYHFIHSFCNFKETRLPTLFYLQSLVSLFVVFSKDYLISTADVFDIPHYFKATSLFSYVFIIWFSTILFTFIKLLIFLRSASGEMKVQASFLFWGMLFGFLGAITSVLPAYNVTLTYPAWHSFIFVYAFIITYALLRHNILGIKVNLKLFLIPVIISILFFGILVVIFFHPSLFALAGLSLGVLCFLLAFIVFVYSNQEVHRLWALFNFVVALWGLGTFFVGISTTYAQALFSWKFSYTGGILIAVLFHHVVCSFCKIEKRNIVIFSYIQGFLFICINLTTDLFVGSLDYLFNSFYYNKATLVYFIWFLIWTFLVVSAFINLFQFIIKTKGIKHKQALYLFWGMLLGFIGGTSTVAPSFGILIYPAWHFTICIYAAVMTYAMFRYQIMDISIAVTRLGIFTIVYSIVLGIPFGMVFWIKKWLVDVIGENWFWTPMLVLALFSTAGPFIYFYIQKGAEDRLLKEQKTYQATLRKASGGMGRIKDLRKLLNLIVFILTRAVRLEHTIIYIYDDIKKEFVLGALKRRSSKAVFVKQISPQSDLVSYLSENHSSIVYEEIKQKAQDYKNSQLLSVQVVMEQLQSALVVPIYIQNRLFAFVAMGKKESGKVFSEDDLSVFTILANQSALAIENAKFYEDMKITQQQLFQAEKMATIGTMADGLSHQINNRFHALGFIAGDALDTININKNVEMSDKLKQVFADLEKAFNRVQDNVKQGGEVVQGLLKYSRKGQEGFVPIDLDAVITNSYEMAQFKIKTSQMTLSRKYDLATLPKVKGNFTQLQEVFFNLIDNAYDAMMQRKAELAEPGFHPTLNIYAKVQGDNLEMIFEDNGIGVKNEDNTKLFTPFFTTKLSSKKGTGLGLYVIRKIIEDNHKGKVEFSSKYKEGTQMKILLPLSLE